MRNLVNNNPNYEAGQLLASIIESSDDAIFCKNLEGVVLSWNKGAEALYGYTSEEMVGQSIFQIVPDDHKEEVLEFLRKIARGERIKSHSTVRQHKDGHLIDVSLTISAVKNSSGEIVGASVIARDTTELKSLKKIAILSQAIESAANCVLITDVDAKITYVNPAFEHVTGYRLEEVVGQNPRILKSGQQNQEFYKEMWTKISSGESFRGTLINKKKNGDLYYTDQTIDSVKSADGSVSHYVSVFVDITERIDLEKRLKKTLEELFRSNQELEQFAYIASHDLQEPIRMIGSFTQLLEKKYGSQLDDKAKEYIFYAVDGAKRMQNLIDDLLLYSRVGTQRNPLILVDMNIVLSQVLKDLEFYIKDNRASVKFPNLPVIAADHIQIGQLFQNLIKNAIKFKRDGVDPEVTISCEFQTGMWLLCVKDNGIGIDAQYLKKIFVIFQRLHAKEKYPGTGIGLAVCKRIVEHHGGIIWAESAAGEGSSFYFTLPMISQ